MRRALLFASSFALAACYSHSYPPTAPPVTVTPPANLTYELVPSGQPGNPVGVLLRWDPPVGTTVSQYNVYSQSSTTSGFVLRASTTSASFYDLGVPDLQYAVTAVDVYGNESALSNVVSIVLTSVLPAPANLTATALNGGAQLSWDPNSRLASPAQFAYYRVYSTTYDTGNNVCGTQWFLEGTTVSENFVATGFTNGNPLCFDVSSVTVTGQESQWAVPASVTPSPDIANANIVRMKPVSSAFRFPDVLRERVGTLTTTANGMSIVWSPQ